MFCKTIRIVPAVSAVLAASLITGCGSMPTVKVTFGSFARNKEERGTTPPASDAAKPAQAPPATSAAAPGSVPDQQPQPAAVAPELAPAPEPKPVPAPAPAPKPAPRPVQKPAPISLPAPKPVATAPEPKPEPAPAAAPKPQSKPTPAPAPAPAPVAVEPAPAPAVVPTPAVAFEFGKKLAPGHTLELSVYTGQRSPKRLFDGEIAIDSEGSVSFGKHGSAKIGGQTVGQAIRTITSMFQSQGADRILSIQLKKIENIPVVTIHGSVKQEGVVRWIDGATANSILSSAGGRTGSGQAVYFTREGRRVFHASPAGAPAPLQPGDIITYTDDL